MVLRLRLLRPLFYRPLLPQRRLSSSLIIQPKYDLTPIYAELPNDSKAMPKIANMVVAIVKDLEEERRRELKALGEAKQREIMALGEAKQRELKAEIMALGEAKQREIINVIEKKESEKSDLRNHITHLEIDVKTRTESLLRSRRMCNVRGALEFIRSEIRSKHKTVSFREPTDNILMGLTKDTKFVSILQRTCTLNKTQYKDVEKCMGGLYHTASKQLHGHENNIGIDARDWSVNEVLALGVLFRYYNIPYHYYNDRGELTDYPYELADLI